MKLLKFQVIIEDLLCAFILLTRVPVSKIRKNPQKTPDITQSQWAFPVVGGFIGFLTVGTSLIAHNIGFSAPLAAVFGITVSIFLTGAFHEDGLGDVLDGFGGGIKKQQKLEIMKDSRIGTYGTLALIIVILLKSLLLAELLENSNVMLFMISAYSLSRASLVVLRSLSFAVSNESSSTLIGKASLRVICVTIVLGSIWIVPISFVLSILSVLATFTVVFFMKFITERQIGGISGDVLGACSQIMEIAIMSLFYLWALSG